MRRTPSGRVPSQLGIGDGVGPGRFQHGGGVRPCVQHLHVKEAVGLRHDVNLRLGADVQPCLRVDGVHIGADDGAAGSVQQLPGVDELVDGGAVGGGGLRVGGDGLGGVHEHQREGVEVRFFQQGLDLRSRIGFLGRQKGDAAGGGSGGREPEKIASGHFHGRSPPVLSDSAGQNDGKGDFLGVGREVEAAAVLCGDADGVDLLRAEAGRGVVKAPAGHLVVEAVGAEGEELIVGGVPGQAVDAEGNGGLRGGGCRG